MLKITSRVALNHENPFRITRPETQKIIFLSLEGSVTEEEYFERISELFPEIKSKIQFISVAEDAVHTADKKRTKEQIEQITKNRPKQLVERIDEFKADEEDKYQFSKYPEDEFWIVTDVDKNWSDEMVSPVGRKTFIDEWNEAIEICKEKNYGYAVSNPFFEIWLLLHHDIPNDVDKSFAITDTHKYESTNHFKERLRELKAPLKDKKHIMDLDYCVENVKIAVKRAEELHCDKSDLCPKYFATTVYMLVNKILELLPQNEELVENKLD